MTSANFKVIQQRVRRWLRDPVVPRAHIAELRRRFGARDYACLRKPAEYFLWLVAIATLGYCTAQYSAAAIHQSRQGARLDAMRAKSPGSEAKAESSALDGSATAKTTTPPPLGRIEIPRVGVSAIVEEGEADSTLAESVGHVPGTALPGRSGNVALAAHRDTYFRDLEDIQNGDEIYFTTASAVIKYRVSDISVVEPGDVSVLAPSTDARLTLITCYPFRYVGPAPKRFVVTATLDAGSAQ
jgi:sortase A